MSTKVRPDSPVTGSPATRTVSPGLGKVLIAEDNAINQRVVAIMLSRLGYSTDVASEGAAVLEMLQKQHYDVVLMDCQMPGMDGYEATKAIRALPSEVSKIPIIAVTANALPGQRERCLSIGMNDYISKPIQIELLASTLRKYLASDGDESKSVPTN
jgi:two-component system, sensor histidine kinase and response regulator